MNNKRMRIAVLISGNGGNLQAIIDAAKDPFYPAEIAIVISNNPEAYGIQRAQNAGIKTLVLDHKLFPSRDSFDTSINEALAEEEIELVVLAGFMRLLTPWFTESWKEKIINIHPSLLPAFKGANAIKDAVKAGAKVTGCTIHFVVPEMDAGPIICQAVVPIQYGDSEDVVAKRIHEMEHLFYPLIISSYAQGNVEIDENNIVNMKSFEGQGSAIAGPQTLQ